MSVLAIDLWDKKVWLAVEVEGIAMPLPIVKRVELFNELKKIIKERSISTIVIWNPIHLDWSKSKQSEKTEKFYAKLKESLPSISIFFVDERMTSKSAMRMRTDKKHVDDMAAVEILSTFLETSSWN